MYLQETLEVVIGVIFAWMLLSIAVMQIQEIIATFTAKRSQELEKVLREILGDQEKVKQFYNHPLIKSLAKKKDIKKEDRDKLEGKAKRRVWERWQLGRPAYIPASNFASAVFDIVIDAGTENSRIRATINKMRPTINELQEGDRERVNAIVAGIYQLAQTAAQTEVAADFQSGVKNELRERIHCLGRDYPKLQRFTNQLAESIEPASSDLKNLLKSDLVIDQLKAGAQNLLQKNSPLGESINSLLTGVEEYAASADKVLALGRKNVETWYDSTMDQLNGSYKRWAQWWAFGIGLIIAILFNVDSIYIAQELWHNPATRQATTAYVENYYKQPGQKFSSADIKEINDSLQEFNFPVGWKQWEIITGEESTTSEQTTTGEAITTSQQTATSEPVTADEQTTSGEETTPKKPKHFTVSGIISADEAKTFDDANTFLTKVGEMFSSLNYRLFILFAVDESYGICLQKDQNNMEGFQPLCYEMIGVPQGYLGILSKIAGCFITALAAMQGAPFWFDTLKKIVNVRSAGVNPNEKPKDSASPA